MVKPAFTRLVLRVPYAAQNPNRRPAHWSGAAHDAKLRREATFLAARNLLISMGVLAPDPVAPKRVTYTLLVGKLRDVENTVTTKPYTDGLRDAGLLHDDSPESGHVFVLPPRQAISSQRGVEITVELL
jgi:hypothetical protein